MQSDSIKGNESKRLAVFIGRILVKYTQVAGEASGSNIAPLHGIKNSTTGLMGVGAVIEAAII